ncbi:hypothetical protein EYZ11_000606 [Aspergillus tanneri]|uniref:Uncharacterized protein n=1 Tax=Aspergillus tanneri TaxID=1220188 RepID=A0A4S3JWN7_9EURO|nr:hypothetical protein EYZ11_000606 [Aspergillus tanneri]
MELDLETVVSGGTPLPLIR